MRNPKPQAPNANNCNEPDPTHHDLVFKRSSWELHVMLFKVRHTLHVKAGTVLQIHCTMRCIATASLESDQWCLLFQIVNTEQTVGYLTELNHSSLIQTSILSQTTPNGNDCTEPDPTHHDLFLFGTCKM